MGHNPPNGTTLNYGPILTRVDAYKTELVDKFNIKAFIEGNQFNAFRELPIDHPDHSGIRLRRYTISGEKVVLVLDIATNKGRRERRLDFMPGSQMSGISFAETDVNSLNRPFESAVFTVGNQKGGLTQIQVLDTKRPFNRYVFTSCRLVGL